jgi:hypothetical protein
MVSLDALSLERYAHSEDQKISKHVFIDHDLKQSTSPMFDLVRRDHPGSVRELLFF